MTVAPWTFTASGSCQLLVQTGVTGKAAKMGHRLTIAVTEWRATVEWADGKPTAVELLAATDSLDVLRGEGGITPLLGPEKALARSNALKALEAGRFPRIHFQTDDVDEIADGFRLTGSLEIHGRSREQVVELRVEDGGRVWRLTSECDVRQSDFGVTPYSQLMGAMKVVDTVTVSLSVERPKRAD